MADEINLKTQSQKLLSSAKKLTTDLHLLNMLQEFGDPEFVGSFYYNLMIKPDIDIEVYTENLDFQKVLNLQVKLAKENSVITTSLRNYTHYSPTPSMPKSIYLGFQYLRENILWNFDIWFFSRSKKLYIKDLEKDWHQTISPANQHSILFLKKAVFQKKINYLSVDIYRAVILGEVKTLDELKKWLQKAN